MPHFGFSATASTTPVPRTHRDRQEDLALADLWFSTGDISILLICNFGNVFPNMGAPLSTALLWLRPESHPNARQVSVLDAQISAAIQFTGAPKPLNLPCTMTKSPSATINPGSYLSVGGMLLMRSNRPSRPVRYERCVECSAGTSNARPLRNPVC